MKKLLLIIPLFILIGCSEPLTSLIEETRPGVVYVINTPNEGTEKELVAAIPDKAAPPKNRFSSPPLAPEVDRPPIGQSVSGTGFFIGDNLIVTNNHVIKGENNKLEIFINDGYESYDVILVASDLIADIALLKVVDPDFDSDDIKVLKWGNSRDLKQGEDIYTIGHPNGLAFTVTKGIVSYDKRRERSPYQEVIQTDASINPGNSGGPMFNMKGEVVGVNTFIITKSGGSMGLNFAVAQYTAEYVVNQLLSYNKVSRVMIGLYFMPEAPGSLTIGDVVPDSAASEAGVMAGDNIIFYNDIPVTTFEDFFDYINMNMRADDTLHLMVERKDPQDLHNPLRIHLDLVLRERIIESDRE